jgi:phosphoenolpyruvate synthase/pyruvate phosphate dikinase
MLPLFEKRIVDRIYISLSYLSNIKKKKQFVDYTLNNVGTIYFFRLGISYPELTEIQARAIFEAAIGMTDQGVQVFPEIMVPLVGTPQVCIFTSLFICAVKKRQHPS